MSSLNNAFPQEKKISSQLISLLTLKEKTTSQRIHPQEKNRNRSKISYCEGAAIRSLTFHCQGEDNIPKNTSSREEQKEKRRQHPKEYILKRRTEGEEKTTSQRIHPQEKNRRRSKISYCEGAAIRYFTPHCQGEDNIPKNTSSREEQKEK
ncbi:hypothetical protein JTE90_000561 [Oedothorax gibbosus]|uniref:Uncharacterized protein n=1 Tax=Oedothorax gibbosus TaxID=931172 RepID=A0AAV6VWP3_9ARAC|nr:hypothetical protein JTE90_000561 [Oedothorax gibbosus]